MKIVVFVFLLLASFSASSQMVSYPYPVSYFNINIEDSTYKMAYMDVRPGDPNGETIMLLHGKNFNGYYWKDVIPALTKNGYRVIVPDQIGWGKSDKPAIHYSFQMLAHNTKSLLDSLGIKNVNVVAHSMGGMLATRFAIMYPATVAKIVLENPIGLEDYSLFVPYQTVNQVFATERQSTFESIKKYQQTYYPAWKPEYEQYVQAQMDATMIGNQRTNALVSALTYQMIYEQPVAYIFNKIKARTLLIIGQQDRTVVGKNLINESQKKVYGNYPALGKSTSAKIKNSRLIELKNVGHIPHIQVPADYLKHLLAFLGAK